MTYKAAVIGCGGVSRFHTRAYLAHPAVRLAAACDPSAEARKQYGDEFGIDSLFTDASEMLDNVQPDIVSICTPNPTHAPLALLAISKGVRGLICEKPMAMTLPQADAMLAACKDSGTRLIVSHQRRFEQTFMNAKRLLDSGAIGKLLRMEASIGGWDLMSWGTHWLDIFRFYNDDCPADWVFGQVDVHDPKRFFGHDVERSGFARIGYANGVEAVYEGGNVAEGMRNRLFGTEGVIEVEPLCPEGIGGPIRLLNSTSGGWQIVDIPSEDHVQQPFVRSLEAFIECLESGEKHPLECDSARCVLEQILAIYESSRSRTVVKLPLRVSDNPFLSMREERER